MNKSFFWTKIGVRACGRGDCNLDNLSSEALIFKRINAQWWPLAAFLYSSISSTSEKKYISGYAYSCRNQSLIGLIYSSPRFQHHHTQRLGHARIRFFSSLRAGVIYDSPNVSEAVTMDTIQKVTRTHRNSIQVSTFRLWSGSGSCFPRFLRPSLQQKYNTMSWRGCPVFWFVFWVIYLCIFQEISD